MKNSTFADHPLFAHLYAEMADSSPSSLNSLVEMPSASNPAHDSTTAHVRSVAQFSIPEGKLFYPEPYIASPSYLHSDLSFLHVFQYWYWLWFLFTFLICFFLITFLCVVRWCNNRTRPRRETRGVSRSKCGDLITACVPVSWALSIIVHESTDAADLNDGFGTAELVVGVRAYQWGWEYYYPKSIDLNYNVRPNYSTFIGNSLKYDASSATNLASNNLWRAYQNKTEDCVITPAHLLLIPLDSGNLINLMRFSDIGISTLKESSAFAKIRNFTKAYNSHLTHLPSAFTGKYHKINSMYLNENSYLDAQSFRAHKQANLSSISSLGNSSASNILDSKSLDKFLLTNLGLSERLDSSIPLSFNSSLPLLKTPLAEASEDSPRTSALLTKAQNPNHATTKLSLYPTLLENINSNDDKEGILYPASKVISPLASDSNLLNADLAASRVSPFEETSVTVTHPNLVKSDLLSSSKTFNISGPNAKVLLGEQSIRNLPSLSASKSKIDLSKGMNTLSSNAALSARTNLPSTPFSHSADARTSFVDKSLLNGLGSSRSFISSSYPAVLSSSTVDSNSLEYDSSTHTSEAVLYSPGNETYSETRFKKTPVSEVFTGSREKTPRSINTAYWSSFWSTSNPTKRVSGALRANLDKANFYLPAFSTYADYDFRNDQAIDMLEDLFWENSYSSYNFYDYMTLNKNSSSAHVPSPKDFGLEQHFQNSSLGFEDSIKPFPSPTLKDVSLAGNFTANSIQLGDYVQKPMLLPTQNFSLVPAYVELNELDDSFANYKSSSALLGKFSTTPLGSSSMGLSPRSYVSVFNHFRSDFDDFTWNRSVFETTPTLSSESLVGLDLTDLSASLSIASITTSNDGSSIGSDVRLSNPAALRSSVRNSIVNHNAFQKVFRPRLDEGRAHVQSSTFSDLGLKQPFLSDSKVPYLQLLGKNRDSFFETPLYFSNTQQNLNTAASLLDSLNTPMYDFPFLLAKTSDTMRFTWVDWFAKWKYVEVQPSSVARYSTLGVPYLRKPFDFNSATGDKFQDTELYFTRVSRSRRNYLTNWSYSPFMYNRSYLWNTLSSPDSAFTNSYATLDSVKLSFDVMSWYWSLPSFEGNTSSAVNSSRSGNNFYGKSTWRPKTSIQSYYYNVSTLVDILSTREYLYRQFLENSRSVVHLPKSLCATPSNPLLQELKASFLLSDPSNYSSEYSRDLLYTSAPYFKFMYFKNATQQVSGLLSSFPVNHKLLTNYALYYFFSCDSEDLGRNSTLYKSQYRPLKKGISSMLRLHSTGAVAMPIEIRLQVLASSRDVIHSWAIPSASIKIDCVPGYTSHRMMKFLLTGVYWGQCQEICGRYHHWMPIVVYFMKRDLFFLWCTHFVFTPTPNQTWDVSDRKFSDFIRFASYDKSSWLNEFGYSL